MENVDKYLEALPPERRAVLEKIRNILRENLPEGFTETVIYGMIGYVVPHSIYPSGYHVNPSEPLPFINLASQKNYIALYHMGLYAEPELLNWFRSEYSHAVKSKLDMGKSCIRFKKTDEIPFELIGKLAGKMSVQQWIGLYEKTIRR